MLRSRRELVCSPSEYSVARRKLRRYPFRVLPIAERFGQQLGKLPVIGGHRLTHLSAPMVRSLMTSATWAAENLWLIEISRGHFVRAQIYADTAAGRGAVG
jgi:hypothetical protein